MTKHDQQLKGKKILFGTVPADGHFNPLTGLAKHLQVSGCDVRWYASPLFTKKLEKLGIQHYPFVKAMDVNQDNIGTIFPERASINDPGAKLDFDMVEVFAKRSSEYYEDIKDIYQSFPFDIMIADSVFTAIPFVRSGMNIPVLSIGIVPLAENSVDLAPYGMAMPPATTEAEQAQYAELRKLMSDVVFKKSIDTFDAILDGYNIPHERSFLFDLLIREATLYLQIGTPSFEYERSDIGKNVRFVGALMAYSGNQKTTQWFDERLKKYKKVVLLTQGTVEKDINKLIIPTLEAFKGSDVLVVTATANNQTAALRAQYPHDNIIVEDYIPFDEIMPYASVYITNGGYGGTLLSIKHKLPMVAAGIHEGKSEVCARIGYFKLGLNLATDTPTSEQVKDAVNKVLTDSSYKEHITRLADEINTYNAIETSAGYVAQLIKAHAASEVAQ
ncbi:glycosyltransferase [Chitinophaga sp. CF418]|uniref:glycosyltransferase n=1 Tax=Chitinophaga sp. CF418 TaxID=1855287 RepID=UPI0009188705|nr:nucleotide disphospho-sugar-binding domain-containing protein [Chitinophaga sp. CF418]SHL94274.1 glycosyltransferase, MGT family [Chitinophaga sp. CF418]